MGIRVGVRVRVRVGVRVGVGGGVRVGVGIRVGVRARVRFRAADCTSTASAPASSAGTTVRSPLVITPWGTTVLCFCSSACTPAGPGPWRAATAARCARRSSRARLRRRVIARAHDACAAPG